MNKTWNIIYYTLTVLVSLAYLFGSYSEIARQQSGIDLMLHLGYPIYLLTILGVAKFLAVVGIWQKFSPTLREWAYAGIFINLIGALVSHLAVGDGIEGYAGATIGIIIVAISYIALKKRMAVRVMSV